MQCDRCDQQASVHLRESIEGTVREVHYCLECAQRLGVAPLDPAVVLPLESILQKFVLAHLGEIVGELARRRCPCCRISFMEFRSVGRLGCPHDYTAFHQGLVPLLGRAHGATRHVGKRPRRRPTRGPELIQLRTALAAAVAEQDYETAAQLRDAIRDASKDATS
ncbi:MAG: UvrB/UvrC protein [Isosphaeraceae bacterium]|jgi:protein arginine kinase activator|nr:MAG: UvrB/UvrC protein [Isosphaeraceae bacterium]